MRLYFATDHPLRFSTEAWGLRADGSEFVGEMSWGIVETPMGPLLLAIGRDDELVAAEPRHGVGRAHGVAQRGGPAGLRPPGTACVGARGSLLPARARRRLAAIFPDARLVEVPDSRTFVPLDQPERLAELIREHSS